MSPAGNFAAQRRSMVRDQAGGQGSGPLACWLLQGGPCEAGVTLSAARRGLTLSGGARVPGGVVWHPLGLCAGDGHRPRIRCPQLWLCEGMEENSIHSLFLSSSFKCEGGVQRQMSPLRALGSDSLGHLLQVVPGK